MANPVVGSIMNEIEQLLWYHVEEFDVSYMELIGALDLVKSRWTEQALADILDEDEDE